MKAIFNDESEKWHLIGARGCGARPDGETIDATWSKIRDRVERDTGSRWKNCDWP